MLMVTACSPPARHTLSTLRGLPAPPQQLCQLGATVTHTSQSSKLLRTRLVCLQQVHEHGPSVKSLQGGAGTLQTHSGSWLGSAHPQRKAEEEGGTCLLLLLASCCLRFLGAAPQGSFFTLEAVVPSRSSNTMAELGVQFFQHVQNKVHQATSSSCPSNSGGSPQGPSLQAQRHLCQLSSDSPHVGTLLQASHCNNSNSSFCFLSPGMKLLPAVATL